MQAPQIDMFAPDRAPVLVAYGGGVDSTAMIIEMIARGETIDHVLFADTFSEKPETYEYVDLFFDWLRGKGVGCTRVAYQVKRYKNWPPYVGLFENCVSNGTLPGISMGRNSCSVKWKQSPQNAWTNSWQPALDAWASGMRVIKCIGYDCSPADQKRYAEREGFESLKYEFRYPLREWGWKREECMERIRAAGLPVPPKSACYFCLATKPHELHEFQPQLLRRIVLMEARAAPRMRTVEGLWRKEVKGFRGATPKPGSMTRYIREKALLPEAEIDMIIAAAPAALMRFNEMQADKPLAERTPMKDWLDFFDLVKDGYFDMPGIQNAYADQTVPA